MNVCLDDRRDITEPTTDPEVVLPHRQDHWAAAVHAALHSDWPLERIALTRFRTLPDLVLARLAVDLVAEVRDAALAHPCFGPAALSLALRLHPGRDAADQLVRHPAVRQVDPQIIRKVLTPMAIAAIHYPREALPAELVAHLVGPEFDEGVHLALAKNRLTPDAVIAMLARGDRPRRIRLEALAHPRCPVRVALRALRDPDVEVRRTVVGNYCRRGNKVFELAILDTDAEVRREVVERADHLTDDMLERAVHDPVRAVRAALLGRAIPRQTMNVLLRDEDLQIRRVAAGRPTTVVGQRRAAKDPDVLVRRRLAASMHTVGRVLAMLVHDDDVVVRRNVARNQVNTSRDLLEELSLDPDRIVRRTVARHRLVDRELLLRLAADTDESVRARASHSLLVRL